MAQLVTSESFLQKKKQAESLLRESLDRVNAIRILVHQASSNGKTAGFQEEFIEFVDNSDLMTVVAGQKRAYFFSSSDSWIFLERDANSNTLFIVRENGSEISVQKMVC